MIKIIAVTADPLQQWEVVGLTRSHAKNNYEIAQFVTGFAKPLYLIVITPKNYRAGVPDLRGKKWSNRLP